MRICFLGDSKSFHVIRWCKHFQSKGYDVHLITFSDGTIEGIPTHHINAGKLAVAGGNGKVLLKYRQIKKLVRSIQPDVLHALYATSYGVSGALCNFHPYVITALGTDLLISPFQSKVLKTAVKFALRRADWVTVMSEQMKDVALKLGADGKKVTTLPFGIDPKVFNADNRKPADNEFVVVSTRNLEPVYNIPHLLKAIAKIKNEISGLRLILIGQGSLKSDLEQLVKELEIEELVEFKGKCTQEEIVATFDYSHVFVSTSISDGNNISLNEAMACHLYCIATDIPANRNWIVPGENGKLVAIDDVEGLASSIIDSYAHYQVLQQKAIPLNEEIIREKGIWSNNMQVVENHYTKLVSK